MIRQTFTPVFDDEQVTSHLKLGLSGADPGIVEVKHRSMTAYFVAKCAADPFENRGKVIMHSNIKQVFGGIGHQSFTIDDSVSAEAIEPCKQVDIYVKNGVSEDKLEAFLKQSNYLLHEIDEVVQNGEELATFTAQSMAPSGFTTTRVTPSTEINFLSEDELRESRSATAGGASSDRGSGTDEMDVDVDLTPRRPVKTFEDDVAGLEDVKRTARTILALFNPDTHEEVQERYGDEFTNRGGSMLLYGPPGCGKTLVAEAIASEAKHNTTIENDLGEVRFIEVTGSDIQSRYPGESERRVEATFNRAREFAQEGFCVLFFDEVETLIPDRGDSTLQRHERALTNAFLQEMNDIEDNLLVIGATNMPFSIDPAATRRFPIQQFIPQPSEAVMSKVWAKSLASLPNKDAIDYSRLAAASDGYTPAEIADRVLGSDLQRELVESVVKPGDPITPDTEYLLERLEATKPKTVRQYVASVRKQLADLEGYPDLQRYVEEQADELGMPMPGLPNRRKAGGSAENGTPDA